MPENPIEHIVKILIEAHGDAAIVAVEKDVKQPYIVVDKAFLEAICKTLMQHETLYFDYLSCITGVDNGEQAGTMEVIYHIYSITNNYTVILKVIVDRNIQPMPEVPTLCNLWKTANWHEREIFDLLGIAFTDHPDMRRILLPENWEGYPLRKDYQEQMYYHGIKVKYE